MWLRECDGMEEEPEEERICSTLRWDDVKLPPSVSEADLDALIFHELAQNWRKVARVVGRAKDACDDRSLPISVEAIAARVRAVPTQTRGRGRRARRAARAAGRIAGLTQILRPGEA